MAVIFQKVGCVSVVLSSTLLLWANIPRRAVDTEPPNNGSR
jgi:hypothetical protein